MSCACVCALLDRAAGPGCGTNEACALFLPQRGIMQRASTWRALALYAALALIIATDGRAYAAPAEPEHVSEHASEDEIKEAREEFEQIDTNKDGFITREEILEMEEVPERDEIDEFFSTYDRDADGRVTFSEILKADDEMRAATEDPLGDNAGKEL